MEHTTILKNNYINRVAFILNKLKHHYSACLDVTHQGKNHNISRTASRFIQIEKSMIEQLKQHFSGVPLHAVHTPYPEEITNFNDMYQSNLHLIHFLKDSIKHFNNATIVGLLSYWIAGLQVENDEMAKYIHSELH